MSLPATYLLFATTAGVGVFFLGATVAAVSSVSLKLMRVSRWSDLP